MSGRVVAAIAIIVLGCAYAEIVLQGYVHDRKGPRAASKLTLSALVNLVLSTALGVLSGEPMGFVAAAIGGVSLAASALAFVHFREAVRAASAEAASQ